VIAFEGTKTIHGCRQGGVKAVTTAVEEIVAQLNERHRMPKFGLGIRGRSASEMGMQHGKKR